MNILQKIFKEHYEEIEYILHSRPIVMENIEKMINCGDPSYGGAMFGCTHCGELKFVPFRCHSKFCPTCGNKYCIDRSLLDCLFQAVRSVILRLFHELNKSKNFVPGFICVLHTFGRPLEWNPHIHCLLTEDGFSDDGFWRVVKYFKMTRYYGLYARHRQSDEKLSRAVPRSKHRILPDLNKWRQLLLLSFGYDPIKCPKCSHEMAFLQLYHKHKPVSLEKLYERAMAKYHCRSSGKCA